MKVGIKLYPDKLPYAKKIIDKVDFIEVMAVVGEDFSMMGEYDIPYIIHNEHFGFGINLANKDKTKINLQSVQQSIEIADKYNAKHIIVHPGTDEGKNSSMQNMIDFLKDLNDRRIIIENIPFQVEHKGKILKHFGQSIENIQKVTKETGLGFCLDFSHAKCEAVMLGEDYIKFIKKMNNLNPSHYHICDSIKESTRDMHRHFGEGNMDLKALKSIIPQDKGVTIETWHDYEKQIKEIEFLKL